MGDLLLTLTIQPLFRATTVTGAAKNMQEVLPTYSTVSVWFKTELGKVGHFRETGPLKIVSRRWQNCMENPQASAKVYQAPATLMIYTDVIGWLVGWNSIEMFYHAALQYHHILVFISDIHSMWVILNPDNKKFTHFKLQQQ